MRSEQPLTTLGVSKNRGATWTKPPSLTTRRTRERSPSDAARIWAIRLTPQSRAAFWAVSRSTSSPTIPLIPPEASIETWPEMWTRFPDRTNGT